MFNRFCFGALLLAGFAVTLTGCTVSNGLDSIAVTPTTNALVVGGATLQLTATGTYGNGSHPTTQNISGQVAWTSASPGVATVGATSGIVTPVSAGSTTITASAMGFNGPVTSSVSVTVTGGSGSGTNTVVVS